MMMITKFSAWSSLAALWLAQLSLPLVAGEESATCLKSLNSIYESEKRVRDDSVVRRYVLCENTEFYVALNFKEDGTPLDGQYPIPVGRPNIHVFCGEDGRSENNCQLVRGLVHVGVVDEFGSGSRADNILLQGLTFFRATSVNVIAMIGGDITIRDCIFKVRFFVPLSVVFRWHHASCVSSLTIPNIFYPFNLLPVNHREIEMSHPSTRCHLKPAVVEESCLSLPTTVSQIFYPNTTVIGHCRNPPTTTLQRRNYKSSLKTACFRTMFWAPVRALIPRPLFTVSELRST